MPRECPFCQTSYFDLFAVLINPGDHYWNLVEGGGGKLLDPVGADLADLGPVWTFGGSLVTARRGSALQFDGTETLVVETNARPMYLGVVLDTATERDVDGDYSSWGRVSEITIVPETASGMQPSLQLEWLISPEDRDGGTLWVNETDGTTSVLLARHDIGDPDGPGTQAVGIWGVSTVLPRNEPDTGDLVLRYHVSFHAELSTWDTYSAGPAAATPAPDLGLMGMLCVAVGMVAMVVARSRRHFRATDSRRVG